MTIRKLKVKKGDEIVMRVGRDKGKRGKILKVDRKNERLSVVGLNLVKKHRRPRKQGEKGEIISFPGTVDISNVALYCSKCGEGVKIGYKLEDKKKLRICKKCQATI